MIQEVKEIILGEIEGLSKDEVKAWFEDSNNYNCSNGCIGALVYYVDTEAFALKYHDEIIDIMKEYGTEPLSLNDMAWLGFEATVPTLEDEILDEVFRDE